MIELLVVMLIIGVLTAIAVPMFLSQREKAQDSAAKSDVSALGKEIATYFVGGEAMPLISESDGWYLLDGEAVARQSENVSLGGTSGTTRMDWCVYVINPEGGTAADGYSYSALGGLAPGRC